MVQYVNIPIPKPLYERLVKTIEGSGYRSATEYMVHRTRQAVDRSGKDMTISVPRELFERVGKIIEDTGFRNPTEYIVYLTRQAVIAIEADRNLINSLPYSIGPTDQGQ